MSATGFRQIVTTMTNFAAINANAAALGNNDTPAILGKFFTLRNLKLTANIIQVGIVFSGNGIINFDSFPPNQRYNLSTGLGNTLGIYGSITDGSGNTAQLSINYIYYGPGEYALMVTIQFAGTGGTVIVSKWDNAPFGYIQAPMPVFIFGINTPVWYLSGSPLPTIFSFSLDDSIANAYFTTFTQPYVDPVLG